MGGVLILFKWIQVEIPCRALNQFQQQFKGAF